MIIDGGAIGIFDIYDGEKTMEKQKVENVAESIGNLVLDGYRMTRGLREDIGESIAYSEMIFEKRYAYYDDNDYLQGFDEIITINIHTGDIAIEHRPVEHYKRYSSN